MPRLFIAFELPEGVLDAVEAEIRRLKTSGADVRWCARDHLHVTMRFLGEVADASVGEVERVLREACRAGEQFAVEARGVGSFPRGKRPRVVWVGVDGADDPSRSEIQRLRSGIGEQLGGLGFPSDGQDFRAHLTLGRVKRPQKTAPLTDLMDEGRDRPFGQASVKELVLFESRLTQDGSIYTPLVRAPLGGDGGEIR